MQKSSRAFSSSAKRSNQQTMLFDSALASNTNYMNVIKESHESILRRHALNQEKRRILNMSFTKRSDKQDWDRLNKFLQEKQSATTASQIDSGNTPLRNVDVGIPF